MTDQNKFRDGWNAALDEAVKICWMYVNAADLAAADIAELKITDDSKTADLFVVNRLRSKPVEYTVAISHYVSGGEWMMGVSVQNVSDPDDVQRERVAADLRYAADLIEKGDGINVTNR